MIIVEGGQVLLPDGTRVFGDVALEGDRISAVGQVSTDALDTERVDARGCTVMPGLVDLHSHLTLVLKDHETGTTSRATVALRGARQAVRALRAGITRCRDIGGFKHVDIDLRNSIEAGLIPGPKMVCAGQFIAITGGHAWPYTREADGDAEVRKAAREQIKAGADFLKIVGSGEAIFARDNETWTQFTFDEVRAIVEEASAAGTVAAAHVHPEPAIRNAVRAGVKSVEHGTHLTSELARMMIDQGTFLIPTFAITRAIATSGSWPEMEAWAKRAFATKLEMFQMVLELGVPWGIGTDSGSMIPVSAIADEFEIIHSLGVSALEVLQHATQGNADLWGWSDAGRIASGKVADIILVKGDPTSDLSAMRDVEVTIARGKVFDWRKIDLAFGGPLLPA